MNFDLTTAATGVPALFSPDPSTARRTLEFFTADIRNPNTRRAYARAGADFAGWCSDRGLTDLQDVEPVHVATYVEQLKLAPPSIKQRLAALRRLFDWLVVGQVIPTNPATSVRGPRYSSRKGKTPVLSAEEVRELVDSIDPSTPIGLRDRALIGLMVYTFARVGAAVQMRGEPGSACTRRAASSMRCRVTTTWKTISMPTSKRRRPPSRAATCSGQPLAVVARCRRGRCDRRTCTE